MGSSISDFFDDDDDAFPLSFMDVIKESDLTDGIRKSIVWAAIHIFIEDEEMLELVDSEEFTESEKQLARYIHFHGPITDMDEAISSAKKMTGVIIAPRHKWEDEESAFVYVAVLAN